LRSVNGPGVYKSPSVLGITSLAWAGIPSPSPSACPVSSTSSIVHSKISCWDLRQLRLVHNHGFATHSPSARALRSCPSRRHTIPAPLRSGSPPRTAPSPLSLAPHPSGSSAIPKATSAGRDRPTRACSRARRSRMGSCGVLCTRWSGSDAREEASGLICAA
jgi:hypothetical protein